MNTQTVSTPRQSGSTERPFFILLTLTYVAIYAWTVYTTPALQEPWQLSVFTILMSIHIALHWLSPRLSSWNWAAVYLAGQLGLVFIIVLFANNLSPLLGLYMGLIGEIVGMLRAKPRWAVLAVAGCMGLSFINYGFLTGWRDLQWWLLAVGPMTLFVTIYVVLYSRQAEARERAQVLLQELETAHRQLTEYAARVEDLTLTAERQRMARELHDTLAQGLAGLILQLEAADSHLAHQHPERAQAIVQQAMTRARSTLAESRRAIDGLRAGRADDLAEAVRDEADHFTRATGLPCALDLAPLPALPETMRECVLRAVAEGLTNIAKHAQAAHAWVRLAVQNDQIEIEVRDDGAGFNPNAIPAGHYGLVGIRERARLANGRLEITSAPGAGTRLQITLPMKSSPVL